jgi:DNA-binding NtrC family response regulator
MLAIERLVERIAPSTISVLILGETGAGKEVLAGRIHQASPRARGPFVGLNCAALSESLLESELFGHERGAFTGAIAAKPGLLESAEGGTAFLDEIGELPLAMQVKLLRVLEERKVTRVGSVKPRAIDVRFIAATNRDLELEIERGRFRQDLYFRLNGVSLVVPPLRQRVNEIRGLAVAFLAQASRQAGHAHPPPLSPEALALLEGYGWPGNIRELRNVVERALLLCTGDAISPAHLPVEKLRATLAVAPPRPHAPPLSSPPSAAPSPVAEARTIELPLPIEIDRHVREIERQRIREALSNAGGNQTEAARLLGVSRRTLINRLEAYGIKRPRKGVKRED